MSGKGWSLGATKREGQHVMKYKHPESGAWKQHRVPVEFSTRRDAERYATQWYESFKIELEKPTGLVLPVDAGPTIAELAKLWLELRANLFDQGRIRSATLKQDKGALNEHILPALGSTPAGEVSTGRLRRFFRDLATRRAPHTVRNIASVLKTMIDDVIAEQEWAPNLKANPVRNKAVRKEIPGPKNKSGSKKILVDKASFDAVLKHKDVPEIRKVRYVVAGTGGLRDGEIAGLDWSRVKLDAKPPVMRVEQAVALAGASGPHSLQGLKTLASERDVPLHPLAVEVLRWWAATGWEKWVGRRPSPQDLVLPDQNAKPWRPRSGQLLREDLRAAGRPTTVNGGAITFHALRRSFSSWLEDNKIHPLTKQCLMGHAGVSVDQRHYAEASMESRVEGVRGLCFEVTLDQILGVEMPPSVAAE